MKPPLEKASAMEEFRGLAPERIRQVATNVFAAYKHSVEEGAFAQLIDGKVQDGANVNSIPTICRAMRSREPAGTRSTKTH